jgi:hypothetical protein
MRLPESWRRHYSGMLAGRIPACSQTFAASGSGYATWKPS